MIERLIALLVIALTDPQMDHILNMVDSAMHATGEAAKALWVILGPALIGYVAWRQQKNKQAAAEDNELTRAKGAERQDVIVAEVAKNREGILSVTNMVADGVAKVEAGNAVADEVKAHLTTITKLADFATLIPTATKPMKGAEPVFHLLKLPSEDYEPFPLSEGSPAEWKSEPCHQGRQVRFRVLGPATMGFHFHRQTAEFLFMVDGDLILETTEEVVHLKKGDSYQTPADMVHSAVIRESGEVICHWSGLDADEIEIGIWPSPVPTGTTTTTTTVTTTP